MAIFRFDRFARSVSHLARALDEFRALGIEFVSLHEAIDTSTPIGRAMFHIAGAFGEPFGARRVAHAEMQPLAMISVRREPGPLAKPKVLLSPAVRARRQERRAGAAKHTHVAASHFAFALLAPNLEHVAVHHSIDLQHGGRLSRAETRLRLNR